MLGKARCHSNKAAFDAKGWLIPALDPSPLGSLCARDALVRRTPRACSTIRSPRVARVATSAFLCIIFDLTRQAENEVIRSTVAGRGHRRASRLEASTTREPQAAFARCQRRSVLSAPSAASQVCCAFSAGLTEVHEALEKPPANRDSSRPRRKARTVHSCSLLQSHMRTCTAFMNEYIHMFPCTCSSLNR